MIGWIVLIQAMGASSPPELVAPLLDPERACRADIAENEEIMVCARDESLHRLKPLASRFEQPLLPKAETGLLGGRVALEVEEKNVGGTPSKRAMVRMKWQF